MRSVFLLLLSAASVAQTIDPAKARAAFELAHQLCTADNGRLWRHSLCGPMLFADPATHEAVGNQADRESALQPVGDLFVGKLPTSQNIANTAVTWNGVLWSEVAWPLPDDASARGILLMHESFHRLQTELKLPMKNPGNDHLDSMQGRYLFRLELRAFRAALEATGKKRNAAIQDALTFRAARFHEFSGAADNERALEENEGLAEYTGFKLGGGDPKLALASGDKRPSFVRSSAYITGPALGFLLDETAPNWRTRALAGEAMDELLASAAHYRGSNEVAADAAAAAKRYDGEALLAEETARDQENQRRRSEYRKALVDGPILRIGFENMKISFDPNKLYPLDGLGTVYPELRVSDNWGVLEVKAGMALLSTNWDAVTVPAPEKASGTPIQGPGYTLQLNPGYRLITGDKPGQFTVGNAPQP